MTNAVSSSSVEQISITQSASASRDWDIKTECLAGLTTFLTTMYIIVVNPSILENAGMSFNAVLTATVLVSAFSSVMMGLYAKNPIVVAPGMGLNAFFTYTIVLGMGIPWEAALGAVFWAGVLFLILSMLNIRISIARAIPKSLRLGMAAGIGLFITTIGLVSAGFVVPNPVTVVGMGTLNAVNMTFVAGLAVTSVLVCRKVTAAFIVGIIGTTLLALPIGRFWGDASVTEVGIQTLVQWQGVVAAPDFSLLFALDIWGGLEWSLISVIFILFFTDLFDSLSTFLGVAEAGNLLDDRGQPKNLERSLLTDAVATTLSGLLGTSSATSYIESAAGIKAGGKTGLTAVIAGILFLPFLFLSPLLSAVPSIATAPVLVLVGLFMMTPIKQIPFHKMDEAIPAFLAIVLIPLTYSITQGVIWGFLSWTLLKCMTGQRRQVSPILWGINGFSILTLVIH